MSKYTTEIRYICEVNSGIPVNQLTHYTPDQIIDLARSRIFDFSYPLYDPSHKPELEKKILKHYYTREIGSETVGLWKLWLNDTLNLIMPKYNKLYQAEAEKSEKVLNTLDIYKTTDRTDDFNKTAGISGSRGEQQNENIQTDTKDKFSDTPQGTVYYADMNSYLTEYRDTEGTSGRVNNISEQHTENHTEKNQGSQNILEHTYGYNGSKTYAELLAEYEQQVLNIDMMIVNELSGLFMKLW